MHPVVAIWDTTNDLDFHLILKNLWGWHFFSYIFCQYCISKVAFKGSWEDLILAFTAQFRILSVIIQSIPDPATSLGSLYGLMPICLAVDPVLGTDPRMWIQRVKNCLNLMRWLSKKRQPPIGNSARQLQTGTVLVIALPRLLADPLVLTHPRGHLNFSPSSDPALWLR